MADFACDRGGHNFVLNRDGDAFVCSWGCGERRPRASRSQLKMDAALKGEPLPTFVPSGRDPGGEG